MDSNDKIWSIAIGTERRELGRLGKVLRQKAEVLAQAQKRQNNR